MQCCSDCKISILSLSSLIYVPLCHSLVETVNQIEFSFSIFYFYNFHSFLFLSSISLLTLSIFHFFLMKNSCNDSFANFVRQFNIFVMLVFISIDCLFIEVEISLLPCMASDYLLSPHCYPVRLYGPYLCLFSSCFF
jgi:hypothetical protein